MDNNLNHLTSYNNIKLITYDHHQNNPSSWDSLQILASNNMEQPQYYHHHFNQNQNQSNIINNNLLIIPTNNYHHQLPNNTSNNNTDHNKSLLLEEKVLEENNNNIIIDNHDHDGDDHDDDGDDDDEGLKELGAMKEMMYKMAAMQPVDIDPATIRRPRRRNVRISDDPQSVAARHRRERISERIRILQRLVPGGTKMDTASMLDEAIRYVKFLKRQIRILQQQSNHNNYNYNDSNSVVSVVTTNHNHNYFTTHHGQLGIDIINYNSHHHQSSSSGNGLIWPSFSPPK